MNLNNGSERTNVESSDSNRNWSSNKTNKRANKKKINKCDLGIDFVPPDGGWGWLVVIAAGCSNVRNVFFTL